MQKCYNCNQLAKTVAAINIYFVEGEVDVQVCKDCLHVLYFTCDGCSKSYNTECRSNIKSADEEEFAFRFQYCISCRAKNTFRCDDCSVTKHIMQKQELAKHYVYERTRAPENEYTCSQCYESQYKKCHECESDIPKRKLLLKDSGNYTCRACLEAPLIIKRYSAQPTDYMPFRGTEQRGGKPTLYFGIELEVLPKEIYYSDAAFAAERVLPFVNTFSIFTRDQSIPGGWEIKTAPCTYEYHMVAWECFFDYIEANPDILHVKGKNCGMHVHISRNAMSPLHIGRFVYFINAPENRNFMLKIAERETSFATYCGEIKTLQDWKNLYYTRSRYQAVNVHRATTIEVRIFASVLRRERFYKNLEFIQALVDFTAPMSFEDFKNHQSFKEYVCKRSSDFPHLWRFLNPPKSRKFSQKNRSTKLVAAV